MSCFCLSNLDLLPDLSIDASLTMSASAQAALALYGQISLGLPQLPAAPAMPALPAVDLSARALASLAATAQLRAQASLKLGIDLTTQFGLTSLARLTATMNARLSTIAGLNLKLDAWVQLARVNAVALDLTAIFNACLSGTATAALDYTLAPSAWGGQNLTQISAMLSLSAQLGVAFDAELMASLQATATALANATANIAMDVSMVAGYAAAFSAIAQLQASLGINPLQAGSAAVRARVAANFSAMMSLAARLGIDLSLGIPGLPPLLSIPGFDVAMTANLTARLQAALDASTSLNALASLDTNVSIDVNMSVLLAVSLCVSLSAVLDISVAFPRPCGSCDLLSIMGDLSVAVPSPEVPGPVPGLSVTSPAPVIPGSPPAVDPAAAAAASTATVAASTGSGAGAVGGSGSGGGGGGSAVGGGGGGGGGGVQATVMTAQLMCTFGLAPSVLSVLPTNRTMISSQVAANIMDHAPVVNITPFGMCTSLANPTVASATAAALGVLTPMPCIPATSTPWATGSPTVLLGGQPMLNSTSKCMCNWAGVISIAFPGQVQTSIP